MSQTTTVHTIKPGNCSHLADPRNPTFDSSSNQTHPIPENVSMSRDQPNSPDLTSQLADNYDVFTGEFVPSTYVWQDSQDSNREEKSLETSFSQLSTSEVNTTGDADVYNPESSLEKQAVSLQSEDNNPEPEQLEENHRVEENSLPPGISFSEVVYTQLPQTELSHEPDDPGSDSSKPVIGPFLSLTKEFCNRLAESGCKLHDRRTTNSRIPPKFRQKTSLTAPGSTASDSSTRSKLMNSLPLLNARPKPAGSSSSSPNQIPTSVSTACWIQNSVRVANLCVKSLFKGNSGCVSINWRVISRWL